MGVNVIQMMEVILVVVFVDEEVVVAFGKYLELVLFQHDYINATCCLEGFVVVVVVVVQFHGQHQATQEQPVHVEPIQSELFPLHVPGHYHYCNDKTLG